MNLRMNMSYRGIVPLVLMAALWVPVSAFSTLTGERQQAPAPAAAAPAAARPPASSLTRPASPAKPTDADGFIQRWLLLEPIARRTLFISRGALTMVTVQKRTLLVGLFSAYAK